MIQLSQLKLIFECCCLSLPVVHDTLASFDMTEQCLLYSCLSFGYAKGAGVCSHVTETIPTGLHYHSSLTITSMVTQPWLRSGEENRKLLYSFQVVHPSS